METKPTTDKQIIYVYDALCGWCYGFSSVINKIAEAHSNQFSVQVVSGGMITGDREGPIGKVAAYIKWAYKDVEQRTGVKFGRKFLDETLEKGDAYFTSVPPAKALAVAKNMDPQIGLRYATALQNLIYFEGIHPTDSEAYVSLADSLGLDKEQFRHDFNSATAEQLAKQDFELSTKLQVRGFPTVFILKDGVLNMVAHGYTDFEPLNQRILEFTGA